DSNGSLTLTGRLKTQINVGNEMVSPEEIESLASAISGVLGCAAGSVPDPILGEVVGLLCILEADGNRLTTLQNIKSTLNASFTRSKRPRYYHCTVDGSAIPRTEYGKIDRTALKTVLKQIFDGSEKYEQFSSSF